MKKTLSLFFISVFLISCTPSGPNIQNLIIRKEVPVPPYFYYAGVAWLNDNTIALEYYPEASEPIYRSPDVLLSLYDLETAKLHLISMPENDGSVCENKHGFASWLPGAFSRSSKGGLVVVAGCSDDILGGPNLLLKYDSPIDEPELLFDYNKKGVGMSHFTFITDKILIQEKPVGNPMNNELYMISLADSSMTRLLPDFQRARLPTWSSQNKMIAFWGTAQSPVKKPDDQYTFNDIETLVRAPWNLYIMARDGNNPKIILPHVSNIGGLAWSPNGDWLAFGGIVNNVDGIWLLNINNPNPIRIFDNNEIFDWSPEGEKIIVVGTKEFDAKNNDVPVKGYTLELPECVFLSSCNK